MTAPLLQGRERTVSLAVVALTLLIGCAGFALAATEKQRQASTRALFVRRQIATWLAPVEEYRSDNGSYSGMSIARLDSYAPLFPVESPGARLRFVGADRYCIELGISSVYSRAGSLAPIVPGPCTRKATLAAPLAHDGRPPDLPTTPEIIVPRPPAWGKEPFGRLWELAQAARWTFQSYWLEHHGSYQGLTAAAVEAAYPPPLPWRSWSSAPVRMTIALATRRTFCATFRSENMTSSFYGPSGLIKTVRYPNVSVSLHGPSGRVTPGSCG
jgi:hypothetical protein